MVYLALAYSVGIFATAWLVATAKRSLRPLGLAIAGWFAVSLGNCMLIVFPACALCGAVMLAAWTCRATGGSRRAFAAWLIGAATLTLGGCGGYVVMTDDLPALRDRYPFVSLTPRLGVGRAVPPVTADVTTVEWSPVPYPATFRTALLETLHDDTLRRFVNAPGFGVARGSLLKSPTDALLTRHLPEAPAAQPASSPAVAWRPEQVLTAAPADVRTMHTRSGTNFVDPVGFGIRRDGGGVAGFHGHAVERRPDELHGWLRRLDLIGVVVHAAPVAYVSDRLPAMEQLRAAPTRPLDAFEAAGLDALKRGELLFVQGSPPHVRALGAIRAASQCTTCHGCDRGDLLGAFSYTLEARP